MTARSLLLAVAAAPALLQVADAMCSGNSECPTGQFCFDTIGICLETPAGHAPIADGAGVEECQAGTYAPLPSNNPECIACEPGKYQLLTGYDQYANDVQACDCIPAGKQSPMGAVEPEDCAAGFYSPEDCSDSFTCLQCETGKYQGETGATDCTCAAAGSQANEDHTAEEVCVKGTFSAKECDPCEACAPGKYADADGATECKAVEAGNQPTYGEGSSDVVGGVGAVGQEPCPKGQFSGEDEAEQCDPCPAGKFSAEAGATECEDAPAGSHPNPEQTSTVKCLAGQQQPKAGQPSCEQCPPGKASVEPGAEECECAPDGHQANTDSTGFDTCPAGQKSEMDEDLGCKLCTACAAGKYSEADKTDGSCTCADPGYKPAGDSQSQLQCDKGFASEGCKPTCTACVEGTYADAEGMSECKDAEPGSVANGDGTGVVPCEAGKFAKEAKSTSCEICPAGEYSEAGAAECTKCKAGKYSSSKQSSECVATEPGHYSAEGASMQTACEPGTYTDIADQGACTRCLRGSYSSTVGSTVCVKAEKGHQPIKTENSSDAWYTNQAPCPSGKYADEEGLPQCKDCPPGHYQEKMGQTKCECVMPGYMTDNLRQNQTKCPKGFHSSTLCAEACLECPGGSATDTEGATECTGGVDAAAAEDAKLGTASADSGDCDDKGPRTCCPGSYWNRLFEKCDECAPGFFSTQSQNECESCPAGKYQPEFAATECLSCAGLGFSGGEQSIGCSECSFYEHSPKDGEGDSCQTCFASPAYMFHPDFCLVETLMATLFLVVFFVGGWFIMKKIVDIMQPASKEEQKEQEAEERQALNDA